ncbi:MAG: type II toxin-antitoxin system VapC family toxin [Lacipirellulaceae bacterium]
MAFLLDTNIVSAHMRRPSGLMHRFVQHGGNLYLPAIALAELHAGAALLPDPTARAAEIDDLLRDVRVVPFGTAEAKAFGVLRAQLRAAGLTVNPFDLLIASTAIAGDMTLVTHNTKHFDRIPGLRLEDWLTP